MIQKLVKKVKINDSEVIFEDVPKEYTVEFLKDLAKKAIKKHEQEEVRDVY